MTILALVLLQAAAAAPQEPPLPGRPGDPEPRLTPRFTLWHPELSGHLRYDDEIVVPFLFPLTVIDEGTEMTLDDDLGLGDAGPVPVFELEASWGGRIARYGIRGHFFQLKREESEVFDSHEIFASSAFQQGSLVESAFRLTRGGAQFHFESNFNNPRLAGGLAVGLDFLRSDLDMTSGAVTESEETIDILLRVAPSFEFAPFPGFFARAEVAIGGGFSSVTTELAAAAGIQAEGLRFELSYRSFAWDFVDGDENHALRLNGPALSVSYAF